MRARDELAGPGRAARELEEREFVGARVPLRHRARSGATARAGVVPALVESALADRALAGAGPAQYRQVAVRQPGAHVGDERLGVDPGQVTEDPGGGAAGLDEPRDLLAAMRGEREHRPHPEPKTPEQHGDRVDGVRHLQHDGLPGAQSAHLQVDGGPLDPPHEPGVVGGAVGVDDRGRARAVGGRIGDELLDAQPTPQARGQVGGDRLRRVRRDPRAVLQ